MVFGVVLPLASFLLDLSVHWWWCREIATIIRSWCRCATVWWKGRKPKTISFFSGGVIWWNYRRVTCVQEKSSFSEPNATSASKKRDPSVLFARARALSLPPHRWVSSAFNDVSSSQSSVNCLLGLTVLVSSSFPFVTFAKNRSFEGKLVYTASKTCDTRLTNVRIPSMTYRRLDICLLFNHRSSVFAQIQMSQRMCAKCSGQLWI